MYIIYIHHWSEFGWENEREGGGGEYREGARDRAKKAGDSQRQISRKGKSESAKEGIDTTV